jgi:hypothetical protein
LPLSGMSFFTCVCVKAGEVSSDHPVEQAVAPVDEPFGHTGHDHEKCRPLSGFGGTSRSLRAISRPFLHEPHRSPPRSTVATTSWRHRRQWKVVCCLCDTKFLPLPAVFAHR